MTRPDQRAPTVRRPSREARMKRIFDGVVASYIRDISGTRNPITSHNDRTVDEAVRAAAA
jgi:hypothetical protein